MGWEATPLGRQSPLILRDEDLLCVCLLSFWYSELSRVCCLCVCVCVCTCVCEREREIGRERDYANMFFFSENSANVNEDHRKLPNSVGILFL